MFVLVGVPHPSGAVFAKDGAPYALLPFCFKCSLARVIKAGP